MMGLRKVDFDGWLAHGQKAGWVSREVCATHDGIPLSDEEQDEENDGYDVCVFAVRIYGELREQP